jgi:iron complex outermembrane receptor protein/hemoglobin/transferrin/lactoferrin receptor protein
MVSLGTLVLGALAPLHAQQDTTTVDTIIRIPEVVVSASRVTEERRLEQPLAVSLIVPTVADIGRGNVAVDLLRDMPGVHVQQTSAGQGAVVLRGLVGNQVLLLVNGIPLNNGTYRDGPGQYLATIDPESIERIEVIRGPASVLYGSDAQGGVVNVITKTHASAEPRSFRFAGKASSANDGYRGRMSAGWAGSNWSVAAGGSLGSAGNLRAGAGLEQQPSGFDVGGFDAEVSYTNGRRHAFRAGVQHFEMSDVARYDRYVDFRTPGAGPDFEHVFDPQTRQLAFARYGFSPRAGAVTRVEATASLAIQREGRSRIRLLSSGEPDATRTRWRDDVYTPGLSIVGSSIIVVGKYPVQLAWGGDVYHDELNSEGLEEDTDTGARTPLVRETSAGPMPTGRFPDGASADRMGVFVSGDIDLVSGLRLTAGVRWSYFRNEADVGTDFGGLVENSSADLTGQVGIVATPASPWRIAFRLAEGFRAPNLYDLTNVGPVPGGIALPNANAMPERSLSTELGVRYSTVPAALEITGYYTRITDFIDRTVGTFNGDTLFQGERVFQGRNVGTAQMAGVEAEGVLRVGPLETRGTLLYTHGRQEDASGLEAPMAKIPPLSGGATAQWTAPDRRTWVAYTFQWSARQDRLGERDLRDSRIPDGGTSGFVAHGVSAGTTLIPRVTLSAGLENIGDKLYRTHASGVDNAGRHVWVGINALGVF